MGGYASNQARKTLADGSNLGATDDLPPRLEEASIGNSRSVSIHRRILIFQSRIGEWLAWYRAMAFRLEQ